MRKSLLYMFHKFNSMLKFLLSFSNNVYCFYDLSLSYLFASLPHISLPNVYIFSASRIIMRNLEC